MPTPLEDVAASAAGRPWWQRQTLARIARGEVFDQEECEEGPPPAAADPRWYQRAADAGDTDAMVNLGTLWLIWVSPTVCRYQSALTTVPLCSVDTVARVLACITAPRSAHFSMVSSQCRAMPAGDS